MDKLKDDIRNIDAISSVEGTIDQGEYLYGMAQGVRVCRLAFDKELHLHDRPKNLQTALESRDIKIVELSRENRDLALERDRAFIMNREFIERIRQERGAYSKLQNELAEFIDANSKLQKELFELGIQFEASKEHTKHLVDIIDNIAFVVVRKTSTTSKDVMALVERARTFKQS